MTMRDERNRAGPVIDGLNKAIRENPLAAGLIGAGIAWMLLGGSKGFGVVAGAVKGAADTVGSAAVEAGNAVASGLSKAGSDTDDGIKDAVSEVAATVASIVPDLSAPDADSASQAVVDAKKEIGERLNSAAEAGRKYSAVIQSKFSESLDRQPLLLGALGLAIGAGIASTFASTASEREWMGKTSTTAREQLDGLAEELKDRAGQVISDVKKEADRQGLTTDAAKAAAREMASKVKNVAGAVQASAAEKIKAFE
jgi:hypothetical protein